MIVDLLKTTQLTKSFGDTHAVDHVDFTVAAGEVLALIGSNGAGKTTLINLIVIPYSWMHSLALLLLPFAYSLALALKWGLRARLLWLGLLFLTMYPLMLGLFSGLSDPTHSQAYQIVPTLALLVIVLILKIRAPRSAN